MQIVKQAQTPLLIGSAERRKYELEGMKKLDYTNAAYLLSYQKGRLQRQRYDKIHLLPFGEYLPTKESIPWQLVGVEPVSGYRPGTEFTVFKLGPYKFSTPICWENIFPYITRNFVKNGAQFIINITNAAYFGRTAAAYQVLSMNVFRAVENRVYVARAANIGISCIIDPCGRVVDRVRGEGGADIFVRGHLTGTIVPQDQKTFYTLYGDVFAWICVGFSVVLLVIALVKKP
jgi:apolipoprotein N-acyltransferase